MSTRQKDIVDRLNDLAHMLNGSISNNKNKYDQFALKNFNRNTARKNTKKSLKESQSKVKPKNIRNNDNLRTERNDFFHIPSERQYNQYEAEYLDFEEEEEEEENDRYNSLSNIDDENSEYEENTEHIMKDEYEEEDEMIINENPSPIRNVVLRNIKADVKTFVKVTYFRRWRRAFHAKQIQISITNKMKKYKVTDKKKVDIYAPCYYIPAFKKFSYEEQQEAAERLSKPRSKHSAKSQGNQNKNQFVTAGNSQHKPKTEEEEKFGLRRHYIRQIAHERDEKEQVSKPVSQKEIMKTVNRLLLPKKKPEEEPERPKLVISKREQDEISLRLSVPRKEPDEEPVQKKVNKFLLPTKKEQDDICNRLAQPKPDYSPKPIRHKVTITLAEQIEMCERLSGTSKKYQKRVVRKKDDEINEQEMNEKKTRKKGKKKKKGKKHSKKEIKPEQNTESTFVSNQAVLLPTASPVPTQNVPASPLIFTTPKRKVRFNGFNSSSKMKQGQQASKPLSRMIDEALGVVNENSLIGDKELQYPMSEKASKTRKVQRVMKRYNTSKTIKQYQRENQSLWSDDDDNRAPNSQEAFNSFAQLHMKRSQENKSLFSNEPSQKHSHEEVGFQSSEDEGEEQNQSEVKNQSGIHNKNDQKQLKNLLSSSDDDNDQKQLKKSPGIRLAPPKTESELEQFRKEMGIKASLTKTSSSSIKQPKKIPFISSDEEDDKNQFKNQSEKQPSSIIDEEEQSQEEVNYPSSNDEDNSNSNGSINDQKQIQKDGIQFNSQIQKEKIEKVTHIELTKSIQNDKLSLNNQVSSQEDGKVRISFSKEENKTEIEIEEEEEDESPTHSNITSLLKSSDGDGENDNDNNDEGFYFESQQPVGFNQKVERIPHLENLIVVEEEEEEVLSDNLFSKGSSLHSIHQLSSQPSSASLNSHHNLISEVEIETLKEIDKTDMNQFVKENIFSKEEEQDENEETVINDNISGIEAHSPIKGLVSNSEIEIHLFSKTQDSIQGTNNSDSISMDNTLDSSGS